MFTDVFKYILDSRVCDIYSDITEYKAVLADNVLNGAECVGENCAGFAANQKYITACEDYRIIKNKKKNFWMNKIQCNR